MSQIIVYKEMLALVFVILFKQFVCDCKISHVMICDSISDFKKHHDIMIREVIIKSEEPKITQLETFDYIDFASISSLTIIGQIDRINTWTLSTCSYAIRLNILNFYGNKLKELRAGWFPSRLKLAKLSFVNNQVESIEPRTFAIPEIEIIDLSDNKLDIIESNTFTDEESKNATLAIIMKNNNLVNIEPYSFPNKLQLLNLNNNKLSFLLTNVVDNLFNLRGLFMRHNKFSALPNIKECSELRAIDFSHNSISRIERETFQKMKHLSKLDLSHNKIATMDFLNTLFQNRYKFMEVSLAFNLLRSFDFDISGNNSLARKTLHLRGNPWWCNMWINAERFIIRTQLNRNECDLSYFNNGNIPFCMASDVGSNTYYPDSATSYSVSVSGLIRYDIKSETDRFLNAVKNGTRNNMNLVACELNINLDRVLEFDLYHCYDR